MKKVRVFVFIMKKIIHEQNQSRGVEIKGVGGPQGTCTSCHLLKRKSNLKIL